jgi:hypothetical protein
MSRKYEIGARRIYRACFAGTTNNPKIAETLLGQPPFPLVLLKNVTLNGEEVSDHNWHPFWGAFEFAKIREGEGVAFVATPRPYLHQGDFWEIGLSQICWVQPDAFEFETAPVFAPPQTRSEAEWFLSQRLLIATDRGDEPQKYARDWGIRIARWDDECPAHIVRLIESGWASLGSWFPVMPGFEDVFRCLEYLDDRTIQRLAEIAAWCNLGCAASEYRVSSGWQICSAYNFLKD